MEPRHLIGLFVTTMLLLSACGSTSSAVSRTPTPKPEATAAATPSQCNVAKQPTLPGIVPANFATALAMAPDGRLFFTERKGDVAVWQDGSVHTFATVPTVTTEPGGGYGERGLLGLALSPSFESDHLVYAFYSDVNYTQQHVIRFTDCGGIGSNPVTLITLPSGSDCCHKGGRLAFGPDGKLYVTLGEEHTADAAQNTGDVRGKVLRYNPDGSIPTDNPFGPENPVWISGLRNPFGIAFSSSGQMAITSNGPSGDVGSPGTGYDLVYENVPRGAQLQWPLCYGYSHPLRASTCTGLAPDWSSEASTYVPTGATYVDSSGPSQFANHLLFCSFDKGMGIVSPGQPHASVAAGPSDCTLDVIEGNDHAVYYSSTTQIVRVAA